MWKTQKVMASSLCVEKQQTEVRQINSARETTTVVKTIIFINIKKIHIRVASTIQRARAQRQHFFK